MSHFTADLSPEQLDGRLQGVATTPEQRRCIEGISAVLAPLTHGARLQFWFNPRGSLAGLTPLEALARGHLEQVRVAAKGFAET
jgi:hypothetical protein